MKFTGPMFGALALIVAIMILAACEPAKAPESIVRTVEVKVPVTTYRKPPASLKRVPIEMPFMLPPTDKTVTSCMNPAGEDLFKSYVIDRETRLDIWEKSGF